MTSLESVHIKVSKQMIFQGQKGKDYVLQETAWSPQVHTSDSILPLQVLDPAQAETILQALTRTFQVGLQLAVTHCC